MQLLTLIHPGKLGKRKQEEKKEIGEESLPMEDRLALLSTVDGSKTPPRTDTLAQLLAQVHRLTKDISSNKLNKSVTQGLHSNDQRILTSVLDRADPALIDNTVSPISSARSFSRQKQFTCLEPGSYSWLLCS